jgi:hypothetical protein
MSSNPIPKSPIFLYGYDVGCTRIANEVSRQIASPEDITILGPSISISAARVLRTTVQKAPISKQSLMRVIVLNMENESRQTQSALLSLLEDYAERAYYILKTSTPQSVLPTIRSRCFNQRVDLERYGDLIKGLTTSGVSFGQAAAATQFLEMGVSLEDVPIDSDISRVNALIESFDRKDLEMGLEIVGSPASNGFQTYLRTKLVENWDDLFLSYSQPNTIALELLCRKILS